MQSLAQARLTYTNNAYDIERYKRLRELSAEMIVDFVLTISQMRLVRAPNQL